MEENCVNFTSSLEMSKELYDSSLPMMVLAFAFVYKICTDDYMCACSCQSVRQTAFSDCLKKKNNSA